MSKIGYPLYPLVGRKQTYNIEFGHDNSVGSYVEITRRCKDTTGRWQYFSNTYRVFPPNKGEFPRSRRATQIRYWAEDHSAKTHVALNSFGLRVYWRIRGV